MPVKDGNPLFGPDPKEQEQGDEIVEEEHEKEKEALKEDQEEEEKDICFSVRDWQKRESLACILEGMQDLVKCLLCERPYKNPAVLEILWSYVL